MDEVNDIDPLDFKIDNSSEPEKPKASFSIIYKEKECLVKQFAGEEAEIFEIETNSTKVFVCHEKDGKWTEIDGSSSKEARQLGRIIEKHLQ